jgi:hypothetical protein
MANATAHVMEIVPLSAKIVVLIHIGLVAPQQINQALTVYLVFQKVKPP